jgi:hypothetical protein
MASLEISRSRAVAWPMSIFAGIASLGISAWSPIVTSMLIVAATLVFAGWPLVRAKKPVAGMWDRSMLAPDKGVPWSMSVAMWWVVLVAVVGALYAWFW